MLGRLSSQESGRGSLSAYMDPDRRRWTVTRLWRGILKYGFQALVDIGAVAATYVLAVAIRTEGAFQNLAGTDPEGLLLVALAAGLAQVVCNMAFNVYWRDWTAAGLEDVAAIAKSTSVVVIALIASNLLLPVHYVPTGAVIAGGSFVFLVESALRLRPRWGDIAHTELGSGSSADRVIVVGAGRVGRLFASDPRGRERGQRIACYVDDDRKKQGSYLRGIRVAGAVSDLPDLILRHRPSTVVIAVDHASGNLIRRVVGLCEGTEVRVRKLSDFGLRHGDTSALREIGVDELLARDPVRLDTPEARDYLRGRVVLVTGAAGSIGSELCRQIARFEPARLILLDSNESGLHELHTQLGGASQIALADIRDRNHLRYVFDRSRPEIVFHAAAYKHVPILEREPLAALATNVVGAANVLECCAAADVRRFVFISTDKAVEPTNVLGYTKRFGELLSLTASRELSREYAVVRFGNVLGSSGSAVPTFARQIDKGGPVTVTHPEATRYFMTISEAAGLLIEAGAIALPGDLLVLDMGAPVLILELVRRMVALRGLRTPTDIEIQLTGLRPGEKLHERLFFEHEAPLRTRHPRVNRVQRADGVHTLAEFEAAVREIEHHVAAQDADRGLAVVRRVIGDPDALLVGDALDRKATNFVRN
jgi:FlaA1/EpsC-like NDP-sugar epimerase